MNAAEIADKIRSAIPNSEVDARALGDGGDHFQVTVVSDAFTARSVVEQHRMVYAALGDAMREAIHALTIKTMTPEQYRKGLVSDLR